MDGVLELLSLEVVLAIVVRDLNLLEHYVLVLREACHELGVSGHGLEGNFTLKGLRGW